MVSSRWLAHVMVGVVNTAAVEAGLLTMELPVPLWLTTVQET